MRTDIRYVRLNNWGAIVIADPYKHNQWGNPCKQCKGPKDCVFPGCSNRHEFKMIEAMDKVLQKKSTSICDFCSDRVQTANNHNEDVDFILCRCGDVAGVLTNDNLILVEDKHYSYDLSCTKEDGMFWILKEFSPQHGCNTLGDELRLEKKNCYHEHRN